MRSRLARWQAQAAGDETALALLTLAERRDTPAEASNPEPVQFIDSKTWLADESHA